MAKLPRKKKKALTKKKGKTYFVFDECDGYIYRNLTKDEIVEKVEERAIRNGDGFEYALYEFVIFEGKELNLSMKKTITLE